MNVLKISKNKDAIKEVYYIGFYHGRHCVHRHCAEINIAASMKMDFVITSLKKLGFRVHLVSITISEKPGWYGAEYIKIDDLEDHYYLPYVGVKLGRKVRGAIFTSNVNLAQYAKRHFNEQSVVINYHSLGYGRRFPRWKKRYKFRWCPQIEEIYCLSRKDHQAKEMLDKEERMFLGADGYLFVNDLFAEKYAGGKPYAVSYGNYKVFLEKPEYQGESIGIVYTGIINEDRGVFLIMEAMKKIPENYSLHILGFGDERNMQRFYEMMKSLNDSFGLERIFFYGTKTGEEYTKFLSKYQIGVSLMDISDEVAQNAFPSKIMAYMGHSLFVVSSKCECIMRSKVAKKIFFCENSPESIAQTIMEVPVYEKTTFAECLREMEQDFLMELEKVVEG